MSLRLRGLPIGVPATVGDEQGSQGGDQFRGEEEAGIGIGGISLTGLMHVGRGLKWRW